MIDPDIWLKKKGIRQEDDLHSPKETLEQLQLECFATFGITLVLLP